MVEGRIKIFSYGIVRDILGASEMEKSIPDQTNVAEIRKKLYRDYPQLMELASFAIAVNDNYVNENSVIKSGDEVILIPPVSGG